MQYDFSQEKQPASLFTVPHWRLTVYRPVKPVNYHLVMVVGILKIIMAHTKSSHYEWCNNEPIVTINTHKI